MAIGIIEKPTLGPCRVDLRPYQHDAIEAIRGEFRRVKSTLLILPTGTGKTVTFGMIARKCVERGRRCLILAHRGELINQAVAKLDVLGVDACVEKAGNHARSIWEPDCVVASVQTMKGDRLASWPADTFDLIVTDEAHHATADSYQRIYRHFSKALHLGVTATPDRADEDNLGRVFETAVEPLTLWDAMKDEPPGPYLSRFLFNQLDLEIDLRSLNTAGKSDHSDADLSAVITPIVEDIANACKKEIGDRPTIAFTPDVRSADALAKAFVSVGLKAVATWGDDPDRAHKVGLLEKGEVQILCNCALLTEGFDCPKVACIILCRPTKSRALYAQMVGRGTRLYPGKENCLVIDFSYITSDHDLVVPTELFDTTKTDGEVQEIAAELIKGKKGIDPMAAIEEAERIHKERVFLRIEAREKDIRYRKRVYDPMAVAEALGMTWRCPATAKMNPATENQREMLTRSFKVENAESLSKTQASTLIDLLRLRRAANLGTHKQVNTLISLGVEPHVARAMEFPEASAKLDELLSQKRWRA